MGGLRKPHMYSDSRKAQHNSFARYRADLLFAKPRVAAVIRKDAPRRRDDIGSDGLRALRLQVRTGLLGFVPTPQAAR